MIYGIYIKYMGFILYNIYYSTIYLSPLAQP